MTRAMRVPLKLGAVVIAAVLISWHIPPSVRAQSVAYFVEWVVTGIVIGLIYRPAP
ncbi:MAG: hypothetical protein ABSF68_05890 [Candidatus Acidiferrales bacterium]